MYQQEIDIVKSRLRDLWNGQSNTYQPQQQEQEQQQQSRGVGADDGVEEILLFPTFAFRDERLKVWRVQVRGWGFCRNPNTRRVRWAATLMRRFIRIQAGTEPDQMLLDRISYLFASQPACDMARVAMAGIAEPSAFELHHPHHNPPRDQSTRSNSGVAVNLLDAPLVLTSQQTPSNGHSHAGHRHDRLVRQEEEEQATIMQKALQIDAFAWQALSLNEGQFAGEILVGFNELEWLIQSYTARAGTAGAGRRRLVELRGRLAGRAAEVLGVAHLVEPQGISIVSDIDDTIKASNITAEKRIVLETVFARPLQAVPGMAELYREWYKMGAEFHYVSNSPWQLYPALDEFFHQYRFPSGSAHLRTFDPGDLLSISNYTGTPQLKRSAIEQLLARFPERKFVLIGDSGEQDLETYTELARQHPGRIVRIFIRDLFAPMAVPAVTTHTDVAGNNANPGSIIPVGVAPARPGSNWADARQSPKPPLPPKPANLRGPPIGSTPPPGSAPPPKPPRAPHALPRANSSPDGIQTPQPAAPAHAPTMPHPSASQQRPQQLYQQPQPPTADQIQARVRQLRLQAQQWLAFYAQRFYVAPTRSFLRHAQSFLPTVERNLHIIDYDAITPPPQPGDGASEASLQDMLRMLGEIPEPPPPEAQLARSERRLLLWKRVLVCSRGLPAGLCRLFVDAHDIRHDHELFTKIFPAYTTPQM
ncbi:hypothetical protein EV183_005468 [Coemansia sp. RSA 2336]|nr:hypothetical protein EV183_005468 [Coemansia sp. RSA 2336]